MHFPLIALFLSFSSWSMQEHTNKDHDYLSELPIEMFMNISLNLYLNDIGNLILVSQNFLNLSETIFKELMLHQFKLKEIEFKKKF